MAEEISASRVEKSEGSSDAGPEEGWEARFSSRACLAPFLWRGEVVVKVREGWGMC